jgi:beta-lactamase class A
MHVAEAFSELGVAGTAPALDLDSGTVCDVAGDEPVTPASVMKIQVALAVADACAAGRLNPREQRVLDTQQRTPAQ